MPAPNVSLVTTVKMMRPMTSSITAAPSTIWPSRVCSLSRSDNTRAEMPIDVAVSAAPHTIAGRDGIPNALATE